MYVVPRDLNEAVSMAMELVKDLRELMERSGGMEPLFLIFSREEGIKALWVGQAMEEMGKSVTATLMRVAASVEQQMGHGVWGVMLVMDSWVVRHEDMEAEGAERPSECSSRSEALFAALETYYGDYAVQWGYERDSTGRIVRWGEPMTGGKPGEDGTFYGLLPPPFGQGSSTPQEAN